MQTAIDNAVLQTPKATVWVAAGTYYGNTIDSTNAFIMADGVNVYGGFAGNEPANYDLSLRDFETNTTILDGQNARRVVCQTTQFTDSTTWDGFTIQHGKASEAGSGVRTISKICLANCVIHKNFVYDGLGLDGGGAVYLHESSLINSVVRNNLDSISESPGVAGTNSKILNCIICNNQNIYITTASGLSVHNCTVNNCIIVNNANTHGIWVAHSSVVTNCIIWNNYADQYVQRSDLYGTYSHCAVQGGIGGDHNISLVAENNGDNLLSPRFVNPSPIVGIDTVTPNVDWSLLPNSICINHGDNNATQLDVDIAGNARVQHGGIDIGCYESDYESVPMPDYPDSIIYVTVSGAGTKDGTSWSNAMEGLTNALLLGSSFDKKPIWVAAGTYYGDTNNLANAFILPDGIRMYGSFAGNEPADYDLSLRNFVTHETILDGRQKRRVLLQDVDQL